MKRFILEQSDNEFYTSHSGLALAGLCINRYSELSRVAGRKMEKNTNLISHSDLLRSYLGLLCLGKSDYEAVTEKRDDDYFKSSLGITHVPSTERLRQRLDEHAQEYLMVAHKCSVTMLKKGKAHLTALDTGHIPLDADVFPMDNSGTKKENVNRTYKGHDGYAPIAAYLGMEGWCLEVELRPGSQHSQEGFVPFMKRVLKKARTLTGKKLLVRLDSAHDAIEARVLLRKAEKVAFIIKWNPRLEDTRELCNRAFSEGKVTEPRPGKRVALLTVRKRQEYKGETYVFTKVIRVTERTINKHGQILLLPEITVEGWWTNMALVEEKIISLYKNHALSEQFHSEFKTDLDLERLPKREVRNQRCDNGPWSVCIQHSPLYRATWITWQKSPVRHPGKRRRLKTVIQELMYLAARLITSGRRLRLRFSGHCPAYQAFWDVYGRLSSGV